MNGLNVRLEILSLCVFVVSIHLLHIFNSIMNDISLTLLHWLATMFSEAKGRTSVNALMTERKAEKTEI